MQCVQTVSTLSSTHTSLHLVIGWNGSYRSLDGITQTTEEETSFECSKILVKISKDGVVLNLTVTVLWVEE